MNDELTNKLGVPDIQLAGLQIWIHGRQFPDSNDYWDGNWLNVTVHCGAERSSVWTSGSIIHLSELAGWLSSAEKLVVSLKGEANLDCMEPELSVSLKAETLGHITMEVNLTPNQLSQEHKYIFEIDQSYLGKLVSNCKTVFERFPLKGAPIKSEHNKRLERTRKTRRSS